MIFVLIYIYINNYFYFIQNINEIMKIIEITKDFIKNSRRSVKILGRAGVLYKDNNIKYLVDSELLFGGEYQIVIFKHNIKYYDSSKEGEISEELKDDIVKNVCKLLQSSNFNVEVID